MQHATPDETAPVASVVVICKNERALGLTLDRLRRQTLPHEVIVVDASAKALDDIRVAHPEVRWIDFVSSAGHKISIAEQRNVGVRAARTDLIAFTDASCDPVDTWLADLTAPLREATETVTVGRTTGTGTGAVYHVIGEDVTELVEAPTINLAFTRAAYDEVGGLDESFDYGSDVDFTWRLRKAGHRLRVVPKAVVSHDWGNSAMLVKRSFRYGAARAHLYAKHPDEIARGVREDPVVFAYPAFLLAAPLTLTRRGRWIPALLLLPLWRTRHDPRPVVELGNKLVFGVGALAELAGVTRPDKRSRGLRR